MDLWLIWVIAGFALVIAELLTGTFYLLVIGLGAFAAALVAWMGGNLLVQAALGGGVSLAGALAVHHWHQAHLKTQTGDSNFLDRGQAVVLEGWANETARIARVRYRGTTWDARLAHPGEHPPAGATLYIVGQEGNTFVVDLAPSPA
jgi:membrane protein implicated in regulation of membrane protease activity